MQLDLREIIHIPGGKVSFDYEPDLSGLETGSVQAIMPGARAYGMVENRAGGLQVEASLDVEVMNACSRCLKEVACRKSIGIHAVLIDGEEESDDPDFFNLSGNLADVDEIVVNAFVLDEDEYFLCREDCKGLCSKCGADLNVGPCDCREEIDPRLAVLGQLLENE
ncbi:MAG: DUF177 domain-containing protein [Oscillospiraceae bacterium]|nr:DUF177 domain-containing protein [Oscillospiraceae bacterium]